MKTRNITYSIEENECWKCTSHKPNKYGYFIIHCENKAIGLHRYMYEIHKGVIKLGNVIRHTCDNKWCINPEHLIEGTQADNMQDMVNRDRSLQGSKNHNSKLTEQQALEIINNNDDSQRKIARKYKVSKAIISGIKTGKRWKHIMHKPSSLSS